MFGQDKDRRVVSLEGFRTARTRPDCFSALDDHWHTLAGGRIMPSRDQIDPQALSPILDRTFLLERIAPGMARIRFAGQGVADLLGMDLRGMPFSALFGPSSRPVVQDALNAVFHEPARCELVVQGEKRAIRGRVAGQVLLLPLRDRAGEVTRAVGCLSLGRSTGTAPTRLDVVGQQRQTLVGYGTMPVAAEAGPDPFDIADTARATQRQQERTRAHLRVVTPYETGE